MKLLTVSIVIYELHEGLLRSVLESLSITLEQAGIAADSQVILVDNGSNHPQLKPFLASDIQYCFNAIILSQQENLGYGAGHNAAFMAYPGEFHLILNPDVLLDDDAIDLAMKHFKDHEQTVLICPHGSGPTGAPAFLSKRYPALMTLAARALGIATWNKHANERYEYRDLPMDRPTEVELASGCCMFTRGDALRAVNGFDEAYFLYFEDFDLSLRIAARGNVMNLPSIKITHYGGEAARKGLTHWRYFIHSGYRFFNQHGWKILQQ